MYLHILTKLMPLTNSVLPQLSLPEISIVGLVDILWYALDISLFVFWVIGG